MSLLQEDLIGLAALAAKIKSHRRKGHVTAQAVWRWVTVGVRRPDGQVVKLETARLAGRYLTSWAAFTRFIEAQSNLQAPSSMPASRSSGKREKASRRATEALEAAGV
jgi:hypothetical protein